MSYEIKTCMPVNITLVYDELSLQDVDRTAIWNILGKEDVIPFDTPDFLLMVAKSRNVVVQIGDGRIRVTDQNDRPVDQSQIPEIACETHGTVAKSKLTAYGFNYSLRVQQDKHSVTELLKRVFLPNPDQIEGLVGGTVESVAPHVVFTRDGIRHLLAFDASDDTDLQARLNAHFESDALPSLEDLRASFLAEFDALCDILERLLEG